MEERLDKSERDEIRPISTDLWDDFLDRDSIDPNRNQSEFICPL